MQDISLKIKKARAEAKLSYQQLGELVGVSRCTINRYELGIRKPSFEILQKIAEATGKELIIKFE